MKLDDVAMVTEVTYRMAEHETLLSFNTDEQNEAFQSWWSRVGSKKFVEHFNRGKHE